MSSLHCPQVRRLSSSIRGLHHPNGPFTNEDLEWGTTFCRDTVPYVARAMQVEWGEMERAALERDNRALLKAQTDTIAASMEGTFRRLGEGSSLIF